MTYGDKCTRFYFNYTRCKLGWWAKPRLIDMPRPDLMQSMADNVFDPATLTFFDQFLDESCDLAAIQFHSTTLFGYSPFSSLSYSLPANIGQQSNQSDTSLREIFLLWTGARSNSNDNLLDTDVTVESVQVLDAIAIVDQKMGQRHLCAIRRPICESDPTEDEDQRRPWTECY